MSFWASLAAAQGRFAMLQVVFEVGAALLGACVGSFLNVVIYRLPQEDPARRSLGGRSHCPQCGKQIAWHDNVPVLGWLWLRGRARCCGGPIAARYPMVEALTAVLFAVLAHWPPFGPVVIAGADGTAIWNGMALAAFLLHATFVSVLVACSFIDYDHRILPDAMTIRGMWFFLLASLFVPGLAGSVGEAPSLNPTAESLLASGLGLGVGMGVTAAIRSGASALFGRQAMGLGDVKFLGMVGAVLGWKSVLLTLFLGCVFGSIGGLLQMARRRSADESAGAHEIPFGPYLALAALIALFAARPILHFLFETWPEWQRDHAATPWLLLGSAILSLLALLVLVRRVRRRK
ncbi:MAG: prepilin peptidase [Planctomycetes bacterium]|nr:prepilin peptidase [Planctomycetota bacterium]